MTASSGIFDSSSKALGVTLLDYDQDGWPDLFVANDTQPNKLYRNLRNGRFVDVGLQTGVALSEDGKARAGMGVDAADFDNSGRTGLAVTNFEGERLGLYRARRGGGVFQDVATRVGSRRAVAKPAWLRLRLRRSRPSTAPSISSSPTATSTTRCETSPAMSVTPSRRCCSSIRATARSATSRPRPAAGSLRRGWDAVSPYGDFDRDGDLDLLMTTNNGPAVLFRNDNVSGNRSLRLRLQGTQSNRDAIGAIVRIFHGGTTQMRTVKSGASYLSQSELPVTFGVGRRDRVDRVVVTWPNGRTEEFANVVTGRAYDCLEGSGLSPAAR